MQITTSRRRVLLLTPAAFLALTRCGSVQTTTANGKTTVTVNVASIDAWGAAIVSAGNMAAGLLPASPMLTAITALSKTAAADLAAFDKAASGAVTLTFDSTSPATGVASLLDDGKALLSNFANALPNVAAPQVAAAQDVLAALQTIMSIFSAALGSPAAAASPGMTEARALQILHVTAAK